jgi:hypothetical protein
VFVLAVDGAACDNLIRAKFIEKAVAHFLKRIKDDPCACTALTGDVDFVNCREYRLDGDNHAQYTVFQHANLFAVMVLRVGDVFGQSTCAARVAIEPLPSLYPVPRGRHGGEEFPAVFGRKGDEGHAKIGVWLKPMTLPAVSAK